MNKESNQIKISAQCPLHPKLGGRLQLRGSTNGAQKNASSLIAVKSVLKRNPWDKQVPDHKAEAGI